MRTDKNRKRLIYFNMIKKAKINQIVALIFAVINLLWIINNAYLFFAYRFIKGILWLYMVPDWQLISHIAIGSIGLYVSFLLFRNRMKMKSFLLIEFISLVIVMLLEEVYLIFVSVSLFTVLMSIFCGKTDEPTMTMTTSAESVELWLSGSGTATVDWGNWSGKETRYFSNDGYVWTSYHFSNTKPRTIIISGKDITGLFCPDCQLTELDVSQNTALYYLNIADNQFSSAALNALFDTMHSNTISEVIKTVIIKNNPGTDSCNQNIVTIKGWTISTEY